MEVEVNGKKVDHSSGVCTGASRLGIAFLDDERNSQSLCIILGQYAILPVISHILGLLSIVLVFLASWKFPPLYLYKHSRSLGTNELTPGRSLTPI